MKGRSLTVGLVTGLIAVGVPAAPAEGTVTLGADFLGSNTPAPACGSPASCSWAATVVPRSTPVSPAFGTLTSWHVKWSSAGTVQLRVLRPFPGGAALFVAAGPSQSVVAGSNTLAANLPINRGDLIGVDDLGAGSPIVGPEAGASTSSWSPVGVQGATEAPDSTYPNTNLYLNAELLAGGTFKDLTLTPNKKKGTTRISATIENPGNFAVLGDGPVAANSSYLDTPGPASLNLRPTSKSNKKLKKKGKVTGTATFVYQPIGAPQQQVPVKITLKKK